MTLHDDIVGKLDKANAVQINADGKVRAFLFVQEAYCWKEVTDPAGRAWEGYRLVDIIEKMPHTTRKVGSMLVVDKIDPSVKAE